MNFVWPTFKTVQKPKIGMKRLAIVSLMTVCLAGPVLAQGRGLGSAPGGIGGFGVGPPVGMGVPPVVGGIPASVAGAIGGPPASVGAGLGSVGPPPAVSLPPAITLPPAATLPVAAGHALDAAGANATAPGQVIRDLVQSGQDLVGRPNNTQVGALAVAQDPAGHPVIRHRILAVSPSQESLAIAHRLHFHLEKIDQLASLGLSVATLATPDGMSAADGLAALHRADPGGTYDYAHLYGPTGSGKPAAVPAPVESTHLVPLGNRQIRLGMIDGAFDKGHPALQSADIHSKCFVSECTGQPTLHGTAIASLLVGRSTEFSGYLPDAHLYAADVFGGAVDGGSAEEIAQALNWLAQNRIAVTNISLAGPPNALLAAAVREFLGSGHVLVAAVGNGGPAAPLSYPAAYPGVVAVTSVDRSLRIEVDASPGARFAAVGVDVNVAKMGGGYAHATGTSYATPAVTARIGQFLAAPDPRQNLIVLSQIARSATLISISGQEVSFIAAASNSDHQAASINRR